MDKFNLSRESPTKLWVETPIPVPNSVWGYFVLDIFPTFNLAHSHHVWSGHDRNDFDIIKVLDRTPGTFSIADGQKGYFWVHAYLPDDDRTGPLDAEKGGIYNTSTRGLIYVPEQQPYYLDQIVDDLGSNNDYRVKQLEVTMNNARAYLKLFFGLLETAAKEVPEGKPITEFYDKFRQALEGKEIPKEVFTKCGSLSSDINNLQNYLAHELAMVVGESIEGNKMPVSNDLS